MMKKFLTLAASIVVAACGSGGSDSNSDNDINLVDITDTFQVILDVEPDNVSYTIVKADGTYTDYDFQGDSVNNGNNCYVITGGVIRDIGKSEFALLDDSGADVKIRVSSQEFGFRATYFEVLGSSQNIKATFQRTELLASDFNECT